MRCVFRAGDGRAANPFESVLQPVYVRWLLDVLMGRAERQEEVVATYAVPA